MARSIHLVATQAYAPTSLMGVPGVYVTHSACLSYRMAVLADVFQHHIAHVYRNQLFLSLPFYVSTFINSSILDKTCLPPASLTGACGERMPSTVVFRFRFSDRIRSTNAESERACLNSLECTDWSVQCAYHVCRLSACRWLAQDHFSLFSLSQTGNVGETV